MENLFQIYYDKKTNQTHAEYDEFIIRRVTKKQEEKLASLGQKYNTSNRNRNLPKWLELMNRISFTVMLTSFIFFLAVLFLDADKLKNNFKSYLWLIIFLSVSVFFFIVSVIFAYLYKKQKGNQAEHTTKILFNDILETSKTYLSIPPSAKNLEVLMGQDTDRTSENKKYSNVLLSVFLEHDKLCFADLYVVIGIPLDALEDFEIVKQTYRFKYWHKDKENLDNQDFKVKYIARSRLYQADQYVVLKIKSTNKNLGIFIPIYEIEEYKTILNEKRENE